METIILRDIAPQRVAYLNCAETIHLIAGVVMQRKTAIEYYPKAKSFTEQNDAINRLILKLAEMDFIDNDKKKAKIMLSMELDLHFVAPKSTIKIFTNYMIKVNNIMALLREVLGYQKQN